MAHPLEDVMSAADGFLLIGESAKDRFPGFSYNAYTHAKKRFYCLDLDGLTESRGPTSGGKVYASVEELPDDRDDLAIIWVTPSSSSRAVEVAHEAGCKRIWFSFGTASRAGGRAGAGGRGGRALPHLLPRGGARHLRGTHAGGPGVRHAPREAAYDGGGPRPRDVVRPLASLMAARAAHRARPTRR